jgi:hypothetical protein
MEMTGTDPECQRSVDPWRAGGVGWEASDLPIAAERMASGERLDGGTSDLVSEDESVWNEGLTNRGNGVKIMAVPARGMHRKVQGWGQRRSPIA